MQNTKNALKSTPDTQSTKAVYEAPRIIYEGVISTRAGTPGGGSPIPGEPGISPEDLFGS